MDSQLELRVFRESLNEWEAVISDIRSEIKDLGAHQKDEQRLSRIAARLGKVCLEADAWGFDELHHIVLRTQQLVNDLRLGNLPWDHRTLDHFRDALNMILSVLPQCEKEFRRRQSTSNMLRLLSPEPAAEGGGALPNRKPMLPNPHTARAR